MTESGEMRAMRMIAKHGKCVVSRATSEPQHMGAGRKNWGYPTVATAALVWLGPFLHRWEALDRTWVSLNDKGLIYCRNHGIEVTES